MPRDERSILEPFLALSRLLSLATPNSQRAHSYARELRRGLTFAGHMSCHAYPRPKRESPKVIEDARRKRENSGEGESGTKTSSCGRPSGPLCVFARLRPRLRRTLRICTFTSTVMNGGQGGFLLLQNSHAQNA